jgi:acyl carrier protein
MVVDVDARLSKCFLAIFPDLKSEEVARSSPATVKAWDSVATVTLLTLVEEEFGIRIEVEDLDQFTSFDNLQNYLRRRLQPSDDTVRG